MNEYQFKWHVFMVHSVDPVKSPLFTLGIVELCRNSANYAQLFSGLCTLFLQIMHKLCAPFFPINLR